ncbi:hypothetical protein ACLOJK_000704 [Asimina triloba]
MESLDDEEANLPVGPVTDYYFEDEDSEIVSFSVLPIKWSEDKSPEHMQKQVFLRGATDEGLRKVYINVIAWKMDLSGDLPEVSVLSYKNNWIKLQKPKKSFNDTARTILITICCLHYVKVNPETSEKRLWHHLQRVFSLYEIRPSENDLLDHVPLIRGMVERDERLTKSKVLHRSLDLKRSKFIVDDDEDTDEATEDGNGEESDEETDLFDSVCAICDNGGELLCLVHELAIKLSLWNYQLPPQHIAQDSGKCLRSFHATEDAGADSSCESLGISKTQVKVFLCVSATCGNFYHPECVAKLLHPGNDDEVEVHQKKIAAGEPFTCPVHKCLRCKQGENKEVWDLQFALCRRCPTAYHRKCLPHEISFEEKEDEGIEQRAWDDLIPNRILIYCEKHMIEPDIGTPRRNHIKFPDSEVNKKVHPLASQMSKAKILAKKEGAASEDISRMRSVAKNKRNLEEGFLRIRDGDSANQGSDLQKKPNTSDASKKILMSSIKPPLVKAKKSPLAGESKASVKGENMPARSKEKGIPIGKVEKNVPPTVMKKSNILSPVEEVQAEKKILALVKKSASSLSLEDIISKQKLPSTYSHFSRNIDKTITQGKVEHFVEAVRAALQKLEEGGNIEDAKAVCEPEILNQIIKWKVVKLLTHIQHRFLKSIVVQVDSVPVSHNTFTEWSTGFLLPCLYESCPRNRIPVAQNSVPVHSYTRLQSVCQDLDHGSFSVVNDVLGSAPGFKARLGTPLVPWNKLKVYLAPFLHGMRYTSFGRHFTKVDKLKERLKGSLGATAEGVTLVIHQKHLQEKIETAGQGAGYKISCGNQWDRGNMTYEWTQTLLEAEDRFNLLGEVRKVPLVATLTISARRGERSFRAQQVKSIVDKLHWYVQNGDTIVDFCCGANDFSLLMRDKLQESGKQCSFRNFDVIQPKNDFSFEKRDWMTVRPKELPTGSQLIMGLNPPFGVKAGLANKFIDKALEFKPKLLILIVPKETERLDEKELAYDLIWEDGEKLSGKSFYLPGSVDVYDKQMDQWNLKPPMIYLWSRSDWTERHQAIAIKQDHISKEREAQAVEANHKETPDEQEEDQDLYHNLSKIINDFPILNDQEEEVQAQEEIACFEKDMEISPSPHLPASPKDEGRADLRRHEDEDNEAHERKEFGMEISEHETDGYLENPKEREHEQKHYRDMSLTRMPEGRAAPKITSPSKRRNHRSTLDNQPFDTFENLLGTGSNEEGLRHFDAGLPGSGSDFGISYGSRIARNEDIHDIERRYSMNRDDPSASRSYRWTTGLGIGGGIQGMDNGLPGYVRDWDRDTFGRNTYASDVSMAEKYGWNGDLLQQRQIHTYGQQSSRLDDMALRNHLDRGSAVRGQLSSLSSVSGLGQVGSHPSPFGLSSLSSDSSWMGSSVTQRYAPRLDEMNYARSRSSFTPEAGSGVFFEPPGPQPGFHTDVRGFAMGPPQRPFQHQQQGSSGWLDE